MDFTKVEETYYSVKNIKNTTANEVTNFYLTMINNESEHTCKEWARIFYGECEDWQEQSNIAKVSAMMRHLLYNDFVGYNKVEVEPFVETVPDYGYVNLETMEIVPTQIEAKDAEGNIYRVRNRKIDELRAKGMFGYEQIGEHTVTHRKFVRKYYVKWGK